MNGPGENEPFQKLFSLQTKATETTTPKWALWYLPTSSQHFNELKINKNRKLFFYLQTHGREVKNCRSSGNRFETDFGFYLFTYLQWPILSVENLCFISLSFSCATNFGLVVLRINDFLEERKKSKAEAEK